MILKYLYRTTIMKNLCWNSSIKPNLAYKAIWDQSIRNDILNNKNKEKLDLVADAILSLTNQQIRYFIKLITTKNQSENILDAAIDNKVYSFNNTNTLRDFFIQESQVSANWKNASVLNSVILPESDIQVKEELKAKKQIYDFQLTSVDQGQKIKVIKVLRELLGLGLKQAKDFADKPPIVIKKGRVQQGEKIKEQLGKVGCILTLK